MISDFNEEMENLEDVLTSKKHIERMHKTIDFQNAILEMEKEMQRRKWKKMVLAQTQEVLERQKKNKWKHVYQLNLFERR